MSRSTVGPCTAINGKEAGSVRACLSAVWTRQAPWYSWPWSMQFHGSHAINFHQLSDWLKLPSSLQPPVSVADSVSLLSWDYCVWPTLKMVWTKVHKLLGRVPQSWCTNMPGLGGFGQNKNGFLNVLPDTVCILFHGPWFHNSSLCSWVQHIDLLGRPAKLRASGQSEDKSSMPFCSQNSWSSSKYEYRVRLSCQLKPSSSGISTTAHSQCSMIVVFYLHRLSVY